MPHTYVCNYLHCVFSTKDRANLIRDPQRLWTYVGGLARAKHIPLLAAGGTKNHLHALIFLPLNDNDRAGHADPEGQYVSLDE